VMEREKSWKNISQSGEDVKHRWGDLANQHGLKINIGGLSAIPTFSFESPNMLAYKTLITQEMLSKGFLASNLIFTSLAHTPDLFDMYFEVLDSVFSIIKECEDGRDVLDTLRGPVCHASFKRLN